MYIKLFYHVNVNPNLPFLYHHNLKYTSCNFFSRTLHKIGQKSFKEIEFIKMILWIENIVNK